MAEKSKTAIDEAFEEFESECGGNKEIRKQLITKLVSAAQQMEITAYDKPMAIQSKLMISKTIDDLLKSNEDLSLKKLKMRLARKDSETNGMVGQTVVALLKSIRATGEQSGGQSSQIDHNAAMTELKAKQDEHKEELKISDGELEACGSSPTTDGNAESIKAVDSKTKEDEEEE